MTTRSPAAPRPWRWSESHCQQVVGRVRGGRKLRPRMWKGDARCAVALSFDSDHESSELRNGGHSIGSLSWGQYGNRVGVPRILDTLARHSVPATFFVPAVVARLHVDEQRRVIDEGHEIGLHGWIHENNSALPPSTERELALRAAAAIEAIVGVRPVGMRAPSWDFSDETLAIAKELGLLYDSSLMADDDCYELLLAGEPSGVVEIPVEWIRDDGAYLWYNRASGTRPQLSPPDVLDIFRREFDAAYAEGGLFQLTMHPHVIGYRSRIWILDEIIRHARAHERTWFGTHRDVARWARDHADGTIVSVSASDEPACATPAAAE
jgi:peptidoglycan/xylan/chitin deacetylase (PgdA/CDA1 family)